MPTYVTPGAYYEAVDVEPPQVAAVRSDVAGFAGVATMGPLDTPLRLTSWRQFESTFGGLDANGYMGFAVNAFFENGGRACWAVRVAAPAEDTGPADPSAPAAADPAEPGRASLVDPGGRFVEGAVVTLTQDAGPTAWADRVVAAVDRYESRLAWDTPLPGDVWLDRPLLVERIDGAARTLSDELVRQPLDRGSSLVRSLAGFEAGTRVRIRQPERRRVRNHRIAAVELGGARLVWEVPVDPELVPGPLAFATGAAAAETTVANWPGDAVVRIAAASPGSWGNSLRVLLAASTGASTSTTDAVQPADRRSSLVGDVSGFQRGDLARVSQPGARPQAVHLVVAAVDPREGRLRWDYEDRDGRFAPAGLPASFDLRRPIVLDRVDLGLGVYRGGRLLDLLPSLSLVPEHPRYAPRVVAAAPASLVAVEGLLAAGPVDPEQLAVPTTTRWLEGGRDGLAALRPDDLIGRERESGVGALAAVDEIAIVAAPDAFLRPGREPETSPAPPPPWDECLPGDAPEPLPESRPSPTERAPAFGDEDAFAVQSALVDQCERLRDRFAVLDAPPPGDGPVAEGITTVRAWRKRFDSAFGALYFPWLRVRDPAGGGALRELPPSGHVAGLFARFDLETGVHRPPANGELRWVHDAAQRVDDRLHGVLNPEAINAIRAFPGRGIRVYGAGTLASDPAWRWVNVRRLLSVIEESVADASQWAVFEPHTRELRSLMRMGIASLLDGVRARGGLAGDTPEEGYFVKCDDENNPPESIDAGRLVVDVGVAPVVPGEFIVFRVGRVDGQLEVSERGGGGLLANVAGGS
jgi:uncharacterized protein